MEIQILNSFLYFQQLVIFGFLLQFILKLLTLDTINIF